MNLQNVDSKNEVEKMKTGECEKCRTPHTGNHCAYPSTDDLELGIFILVGLFILAIICGLVN